MPVVNAFVNDYIRLIRTRDDFFSIRPIFDIRLNAGVYTARGSEDRPGHRDFTRLGTQIRLALTSDNLSLPLDWVTTYTYLRGFSGRYDELEYFKTAVTFSFDERRYFGITAGYSNGRREDTAVREHLWSISLTGRY